MITELVAIARQAPDGQQRERGLVKCQIILIKMSGHCKETSVRGTELHSALLNNWW